MVVIVLVGSSESIVYSRAHDNQEFYNVEEGASLNSILEDFELPFLKKNLLKIYLKKNDINVAQAGYYKLKNQSWKDFISSVTNGDVVIFKLNIPAGKNLYELKEILLNTSLDNDCDNFECLNDTFEFIEGTLKPDTYFYKYASSMANILNQSQVEFIQLAKNLWSKKNPNTPLKSLSDAIILSSIVEKEAGNDDEKTVIAGVFLHRLSIGMRLQADPTIIYGLLPEFNGDMLDAKYSVIGGTDPTDGQKNAWGEVTKIYEEFADADHYVFSVPMWNFNIPYKLKHFIDIVTQPGLSWSYSLDDGYKGLMKGKTAMVIYASGDGYSEGTGFETYDLQKPYIELWLTFLGFEKIEKIIIDRTLFEPDEAEKKALDVVLKLANVHT